MKRSSIARKSPMKRTAMKASKRVASKQRVKDADWKETRQEVIARDGRCMAEDHWEHVCGMGEHVHHVKLRSQGGTNDLSNLVLVCGTAHLHVHGNPAWSRSVGLLA
jgi:5-methylcytosine-specific restriction endonuclease McrA